jgi:hypothetical protein
MPGGRPRRTSTPDSVADDAVRSAVDHLLATVRPGRKGTTSEPSRHLLVAIAASRLATAAERLARAEVAEARAADGLTWGQIGEAFGTTRQSAHERFRT